MHSQQLQQQQPGRAAQSGANTRPKRTQQRSVALNSRKYMSRRVAAGAFSGAEDRPGDHQTYQRASTVPDSVPMAEEGSDWREFRARLVASTRSSSSGMAAADEVVVAHEGPSFSGAPDHSSSSSGFNSLEWAHELSRPEPGCLLLAHPYMFRERQRYFYQAVILLLDHGPEGSYGIILNRPTQYKVSQIKSTVHELLALFADNRLFMGGDCGDTAMVVLTPRSDIQGVTQVTQGVYHHNVHGAGAAVAAGLAEPEDFRFFAQYAGWAPGQLEEECRSGVWFCTAASPALTLSQELSAGGAMWHAILQVMGGDHARVSDIITEVEQRDLRAASEGLLAAAAAPDQQQQQQADDTEEDSCSVFDAGLGQQQQQRYLTGGSGAHDDGGSL